MHTNETGRTPRDTRGRHLRDLRISVTDRCNFRCRYCMPREVFGPGFAFLDRDELLSFEEITRLVRIGTDHGVQKVRLTGGEPLMRNGITDLVAMVSEVDGVEDLAMTTNGSLLRKHAVALRQAGLDRLTVSLDSLDDDTFRSLSDVELSLDTVLDGIAAAQEAGFERLKINAVVKRGVNDHEVVDLAAWGREQGHTVRFIEFMDVGATNGWKMDDVVPAAEMVDAIAERWDLEPVEPEHPGEVATRFRYVDGAGEIGVIASVTDPFCGSCTRARLSAVGELFTCLFATRGRDLREPLRTGATDDELAALLVGTWTARTDRYSEIRTEETAARRGRVEMSYIGG